MNNTSYKDPSGFVFKRNGEIYRQINKFSSEDYEFFMSSGLYKNLIEKGFIVEHEEVNDVIGNEKNFYKCIKPFQIEYITYPYEWCFSALKDAAVLTLNIQLEALKYSMSLKDASSYNVQFFNGNPIFIDTLSFERYEEGSPWQAYRQFCKHFLAPLALMSYTDVRLNRLLINNIDGIPLDLAKKLLPKRAKFNFGILTHIFLHSDCQKQYENNDKALEKPVKMSKNALIALIENLKDVVSGLKFPKIKTEWGEYYSNTNYTEQSFLEKKSIISDYIEKINPKTVCDLGANRGDFSRIASDKCIKTLAFDIDEVAVEENYLQMKKLKEFDILPLLQDLTNPSPAIGFANDERASFSSRFKSDLVMALALIHHLSISNNLPFDNTAEFFSELAQYLIIEFVPKEDSKVKILLSTREDIFPDYNQQCFEAVYSKYYEILEKRNIQSSKRILYLMRRKG